MTEKRYKKSILRVIRTGVIDENNNDLNTDEVVDLLNELHDENQKLEKWNEQVLREKIDAETKLYKANEQLLMQMDYDNLCKENQDMEFELIKIKKENEQLKQQLNIFEKFLEGNDLDIEWDEFCGVDECAFENPDFSCKECIHLKGGVE